MEINNYFTFKASFSQTPVCVKNSMIDWDDSIEILKGNYKNLNSPLILAQISGKKWTDILNPTNAFFIVSKKFTQLLQINNIKGWKSFDIKIFDKQGSEIEDYCGFSVIGKCGDIDYSKSKVIEKRLVPNGTLDKYFIGMDLDFSKWDGSDIFIPENTIYVIVSKKVQEIIIKNKLTNFLLQDLAEIEMLDYKLED